MKLVYPSTTPSDLLRPCFHMNVWDVTLCYFYGSGEGGAFLMILEVFNRSEDYCNVMDILLSNYLEHLVTM